MTSIRRLLDTMQGMIPHFKRGGRYFIFCTLLFVAIGISVVRLTLIGVEKYRGELEHRLTGIVGVPVKVGRLTAKMRGFSPELVLSQIQAAPSENAKKPEIELDEIHLAVDLGRLVLTANVLHSSSVSLIGAKVFVYRQPDGKFRIKGLKAGDEQPLWLLQGRQYQVLHSRVTWQDQKIHAPPITLDDVNLVVINNGDKHRVNMLTNLPVHLGDSAKVALDFTMPEADFSGLDGYLFLEGRNMNVHELFSAYFPKQFKINSGVADFKIWGNWQKSELVSVQGDAQLHDTVFHNQNNVLLTLKRLDTQFDWQQQERQWQLTTSQFLMTTHGENKHTDKTWPDAQFSLEGDSLTAFGKGKVKFYAKQLDLAEASLLANFFAPLSAEHNRLLSQANLGGMIKDFSLFAEPVANKFALSGEFDGLRAVSDSTFPFGFENVSGRINATDKAGKVRLAGQGVSLKLPKLFAKAIPLKKLAGVLTWEQDEEQWLVSSPSLTAEGLALNTDSRLRLSIPKAEASPFIDWQISLVSDDASQLATLMPTQIMADKLKRWLENAFIAGKVRRGDFLIYGQAKDFPFNDNSGVFEGKLAIENGVLNYHPEWPHILGIDGELTFNQDDLHGHFSYGMIDKVTINRADLTVSDMGSMPLLVVNGEGNGEIADVLQVLKNSPLVHQVIPVLTHTTPVGITKGQLTLALPLKQPGDFKVEGKASMANAQLNLYQPKLRVSAITGDIQFNNQGIYGDDIKAEALGGPIDISIEQADKATLVNVNGKTSVKAVCDLFGRPPVQFAGGASEYLAQLQLPANANTDSPVVVIKSTLAGTALQLPGNMGKNASQEKPTSVLVKLTDTRALPVEVDYNGELKAAFNLDAIEHKLISGHIIVGEGQARSSRLPGLKVEIHREQLALNDWLSVAAEQYDANPAIPAVKELNLHSNSAFWQKNRLGKFDLTLSRNGESWSGDIDSAIAKGQFQVPKEMTGVKPVSLDLDMLNVSGLGALKLEEIPVAKKVNQKFTPLFTIHCDKTLWQNANLGQLDMATELTPQGLNIKRLELEGQEEKLAMTGSWKNTGPVPFTNLKGQLNMVRADKFFDELNITKDLTDTKGEIHFDVNWNAAPWQFSLIGLRGGMDVKLKNGRILSIEPGFGRVLGILAVGQWIKRLQLDFTDIYEEGLSFNSIKGHFDLANGKATTNNLTIDGIPAKITIVGDTDLVAQRVDHVIKVVPKSLEAVPVAGTIVGKIATFIGETLTGKDQEGFLFGTQYEVKGPWNEVKVRSMHEKDGLVQKTWRGITELPWDENEVKSE